MTNPLRGLSTIRYQAADHEAAKRWYTELLGAAPYFDRPGYCEFRIGDYQAELGLLDAKYAGNYLPTKRGRGLDWTLGADAVKLGQKTGYDYALFLHAEDQVAEAKLILIGAVKRWVEAGSGALQSQTAGPFGVTVDTRQRGGFNLWPSEIEQLQAICKDINAGKAYAIDTAPSLGGLHMPWCALNFGATYCSCGVDIAGEPIYELG